MDRRISRETKPMVRTVEESPVGLSKSWEINLVVSTARYADNTRRSILQS